ncbi:amidohydrolase family protein [Actinopolymorpha alba]|uniref:amidohydrolase family protein n=1 Tax=Actinopolymorpha alba TaxID=533267 RepID=UPI000363F794|nr:amidohydrolase family protein [Actinopolymorpha alba]
MTARGDLALTHVTAIDATGRRPQPDMTVLVRGERIALIAKSREVRIAPGTKTVDLTGKYLIPGLCDMHVHSDDLEKIYPPLYIANGVTTVREMNGLPFHYEWRDRVEGGSLLGPHMVVASRMIDGTPSLWDGIPLPIIKAGTEAEARDAVRKLKREGADFIKVYTRVSRPVYHALADEARRQGIPFAGHCPDAVPMPEASDAGQRSFEHLFWTWFSTSSREAEIRRGLAEITIDSDNAYNSWFQQIHPLEWMAAHSYDHKKAAALFAQLVANGSRQVPTLTVHQVVDRPDDFSPDDERLKYLPASRLREWQWQIEELYLAGRTPEEFAQHRELFGHRLRLVGAMRRAGVPIMAGTDTINPYTFPGFSLHDELALLVEAGLTPMEALQAATLEPARFLGVEHALGTVQKGKIADLVVLDANPLDTIRNTRMVHAVVVRGRLISSEQRARMLADVEAAAQEPTEPASVGSAGAAASGLAGARRTAGGCDCHGRVRA